MPERAGRPDYFRDVRHAVGEVVLTIDFLFLVVLVYGLFESIIDGSWKQIRPSLLLAIYCAFYGFLAASAVTGVLIFRTDDRRRSWQFTGWSALFFSAGLGIAILFAIMIDRRYQLG